MKPTTSPHIFSFGNTARPQQPSEVEMETVMNLFRQGRVDETEQQALRMTKLYPQHFFGWKILGVVLRIKDRTQEALKPMQTACKLAPRDFDAFNNLGSTLQALGDNFHAEPCYRHSIEVNPEYATGYLNLGHLLWNQERRQEALPIFERYLALRPEDDYVRHLVQSMNGEQSERAPEAYVKRTFDDYAETFEAHLVSKLQYNVPQRLVDAIDASGAAPATPWRVLDLGCGTGLVADAIGDKAGDIVGVDLSEGMLDKARAKKRYSMLVQADLQPAMEAEPAASYDLVTSADVFIYVGKIDGVVAQAKRVLRAGGLLAFSVEAVQMPEGAAPGTEPDHQLKVSGRYGQSAAYLARLAQANGFKVVSQTDCVLRIEEGVPVQGQVLVWQA